VRIELDKELVRAAQCRCGQRRPVDRLLTTRTQRQLQCACGEQMQPVEQTHWLTRTEVDELQDRTFAELGFPLGEMLTARNPAGKERFVVFAAPLFEEGAHG
jgi:hypothetical protein